MKSDNVDSQNEKATFTWDDPQETIDSYEFEILNKDSNSYENASDIMADDQNLNNDWGVEFECQKLIDNFGYQAGDTITFRVRASNSVGASEWSYPTTSNMLATSLFMLI